jgi:hypothetical protein
MRGLLAVRRSSDDYRRRTLILLVLAVALAGCSSTSRTLSHAAQDAAQGAAERAGQAVEPPRGYRPPAVEPESGGSYTAVVRVEAEKMKARYTSDLSVSEARFVVGQSCARKDQREVLEEETLNEQVYATVQNLGGRATLALRITSLIDEMYNAESSGDSVASAAVFLLCESA